MMLRKIRILVSAILFLLITCYFLDFAGILPSGLHWLAKIQFIPACLSLSFVIVGIWLLITFFFGRIYCSSVCPLGIFQDIFSRIPIPGKKKRFHYSPQKKILRWSFLLVMLITLIAGFTLFTGLLDPYSAYGRMVTALFKPAYLAANNLLEWIFVQTGSYRFYRMEIILHSTAALITGVATFLLIGGLAWLYGRTWCNTICPVGTLFGGISRYSLFRIRINEERCIGCGICERKCKARCIDSKGKRVDNSRCVACFNCLSGCKFDAISYSASKSGKAASRQSEIKNDTTDSALVNHSRRQFLLTSAATTVAIPTAVAQNAVEQVTGNITGTDKKRAPIAPPGAVSYEHLRAHCTSCHLCVSKCPSNVIKPALLEYGLGGMLQPTLYFEKGFCNYDCTVCGEVCPNGAILPLTREQKHFTQSGYVVFKAKRCVVITDGTNCGACSEHCPTQAVKMVPIKGGLTLPKIDRSICIGCGGCEYICPARPLKAIYVEGLPEQTQRAAFNDGEQQQVIIDDFGF